jgi:YfiH family protein
LRNDFFYVENETPYYKGRLFDKYGIRHAFFTRKGGVSKSPFDSLNFALGAGEMKDSEENLMRNYSIAASVFGLKKEDVCRTFQTHTSTVVYADENERGRGISFPNFDYGVDGLVTDKKDLLLSVRTADCVPILLFDKESQVCGAVHAGWRGTVGKIAENAINMMEEKGAKRENILAAIGPCIGDCCYEVGREVFDGFVSLDKKYETFFKPSEERFMLDLTLANITMLADFGIKEENISSADICTKCNEEDFFSHRRNGVNRGTMSAFICI